MRTHRLRVAIAGGGTGRLAAANALVRRGAVEDGVALEVLLAGCDRADDHDVELRASEFAAVEGRRRLPT